MEIACYVMVNCTIFCLCQCRSEIKYTFVKMISKDKTIRT